jgi:transposase
MAQHCLALRAQSVALKAHGVSASDVRRETGVSERQLRKYWVKATSRGYKPNESKALKDEYLTDEPRSGRPKVLTDEKIQELNDLVTRDRHGREKTCQQLGKDAGISAMSAWRGMRMSGLTKCKPTRKPGLTKAMKEARYQFALRFEDWGLEEWKDVIWTDETSIILGHRRGQWRVWRSPADRFKPSVVRNRWKGASEFMFWGSFSYDRKGPCHIWQVETAKQRRDAQNEIDELNEQLEPELRRAWELETGMNRLGLRNRPGKQPVWKWDKAHGKRVRRNGHGGIDWWRYQHEILKPKLIPFAQDCARDRPNTIVQEDKAPAHVSPFHEPLWAASGVKRLKWCGNSPDLNQIEPCWYWLKRKTTSKGAPDVRAQAVASWT